MMIPLYVIDDSPPPKLKPLDVTMLLGNTLKAFMVMPADPVSKASGRSVGKEPTWVTITNMRGSLAYPTGYKLSVVGSWIGPEPVGGGGVGKPQDAMSPAKINNTIYRPDVSVTSDM